MKWKWEWNGRRLQPPLTIARMLVALPGFMLGRIIICVFAWIGWGRSAAEDIWSDTR